MNTHTESTEMDTVAEPPLVSIVICTWNRAFLLRRTLESMTQMAPMADGRFEILVVDNNSTDDTASAVASFADRLPVRRIFEPTSGLSHARNRALIEARGTYLLWTDDDVLVSPAWLASWQRAASRHREASVFGGPIEPWFPADPDPDLTEGYPALARGFCGLDFSQEEGPLGAGREVLGANMGFKRAALAGHTFDTHLGFSPTSQRGGEEVKLVRQLIAQGATVVWVPEMKVRHYVDPARSTESYLTRYYYGRGQEFVAGAVLLPPSPMFGGVPRWLVRELLEALIHAGVARVTGLSMPVSRRLRSGPPPRGGASRRVKTLAWMREYHWLRGAIDEFRRKARGSVSRPSAVPQVPGAGR